MTVCGRGCCWSPYSCGKAYSCACHWDEKRPAIERGDAYQHRDPTAKEAIKNVMKARKK